MRRLECVYFVEHGKVWLSYVSSLGRILRGVGENGR